MKKPTLTAVKQDTIHFYAVNKKVGPQCWDCGSTKPGHHTKLCDLAPRGAARDLPSIPGTQWAKK